MAKRKRPTSEEESHIKSSKVAKVSSSSHHVYLQIVAGSYERVLHGITAAIPLEAIDLKDRSTNKEASVSFTDSFLFNAHASAIKCLAISPPPPPTAPSQKVILATGSSDEKINLFHLSTRQPKGPILPSLGSKTQENADNRSLGTLHTHDSSITALHFPNRSKLLSSCGNNVIAITSTRNFGTLSLIKAPNPKHPNRPIGDTSTPSTLPCGVNDFAVHPSLKLMISVSRAERCMRLWNLVTGKKAGVLSFDKEMLREVGESTNRWGTGEGRRILWNEQGEEYAVTFEKGVCIFSLDCKPKAKIVPSPPSTIHQLRYVPAFGTSVLAVSTEDGRILFYSTDLDRSQPLTSNGKDSVEPTNSIPACRVIGQLGGENTGVSGRIKDFHILSLLSESIPKPLPILLIITAGSDGTIRLWAIENTELLEQSKPLANGTEASKSNSVPKGSDITQVGKLLDTYNTGSRITCLTSFFLFGAGDDKNGTLNEESHGSSESDENEGDDDESDESHDVNSE